MSKFFTFVAAMLVSSVSAQFGLVNKVVSNIKNDFGTVKHVVDSTGIKLVSTQCATLQNVRHFNDDESKPDLTGLTINFITSDVKITYNLQTAAEYLHQSPWFNASKSLFIYYHGFTDEPNKESYSNIGQALMNQGNNNVVALDASSQIGFWYIHSSIVVEFIGKEFAKMLEALCETGLDPKNIHLIGHSLGSHIAGFTGKTFLERTGKHIGRISGLDPAGPCFMELKADRRLSKDHADFVDILHTDMGVYGLDEQIGHVDFYPNGGYQQPNCILQTCSHSRAWELFAESVGNEMGFIGVSCPDYDSFREGNCDYSNTSVLGLKTPCYARGRYYFQTNNDAPYGLGEEGTHYDDQRGTVTKIVNKLKILKK